jgi:nucleotide-binding universal stress UspA family protein
VAPVSSLRSFFLGQPLEDVLRRCRRPVLVVRRRAERAYGRLLVAVDFSAASRGLIELGFALNKSADVELFHAVTTANENNLRNAEASQHAISAYRHECLRFAQGRMLSLADSCGALRNRALSAIGHGDPAQQSIARQQHSGAELIVVGKHPASLLADRVFGSIAKRVLRDARTDVLVVPHDYRIASKASAVSRLNAEPPIVRRLRAGTPLPPGGPSPAAVFDRT